MEHCYKTFISIGNGLQSFSRLLNAVESLNHLLPKPVIVQAGHTHFVSKDNQVVDFVSMDDFIRYVNDAQLLILHAGAGSIMNAIKAGKCPIVMPRMLKYKEVINDHQVSLAKMMHAEGRVIMTETEEELEIAIKRVLSDNFVSSTKTNSKASLVIKNKLDEFLNE